MVWWTLAESWNGVGLEARTELGFPGLGKQKTALLQGSQVRMQLSPEQGNKSGETGQDPMGNLQTASNASQHLQVAFTTNEDTIHGLVRPGHKRPG